MKGNVANILLFLNILVMFKIGDLSTIRDDIGGLDGYVFLKLVIQSITVLYSLFCVFILRIRVNVGTSFVLYLFFGVCSSILSADLLKSLYFSFSVGLAYLFTVVYMRIIGPEEWLEKVYVNIYKLVLWSTVISVLIFPEKALRLAYDFRLQSILIYVGSNGLSWFLLCYFLYLDIAKRRIYRRVFLSLLILLTQSRTAVVLLVTYVLIRLLWGRKYLFVPSSVLCIILLGYYSEELFLLFSRGETQFEHLSGRVIMWQYAIESWLESPWVGKGHWIGVRDALGMTIYRDISQLHNSYVEVLLATGVLGLLGWLFYVLGSLVRAIRILLYRKSSKEIPVFVQWSSVVMLMFPVKMFSSSEGVYFDHSLLLLLLIGFTLKNYMIYNEDSALRG